MKRLGRLVHHDERSRAFTAPMAATLVTRSHRRYGATLDQGDLGSCTTHAAAHSLNSAPLYNNRIKANKLARLITEKQAVAAYSRATQIDPFPGSWPPEDTGSSGLAACAAYKEAGHITSYLWAFGLERTLAALVLGPVMIGINWYDDMFTPHNGVLTVGGRIAGGHEVCLNGIDVTTKRVRLLNSWGPNWGSDGYAWLNFSDLGRLLSEDGDCVVPTVA